MNKLRNFGILTLLAFGLTCPLFAAQERQHSTSQSGSSEEEQLRQIQQLVQSGRLDEARGKVDKLLKSQPGDERLYIFLGVINAQENDFGGAESSFLRAIQIAPRLTAAYLNIGRLYQEHAAVDSHAQQKALHIYEQLLAIDSNNIEGNYQAAWLSNRLGDFAASQRYLDRLPAETQERVQAMVLRCANYAAEGSALQADTIAQKLLAHSDLSGQDLLPVLTALSRHRVDDFAVQFLESIAMRGMASVEAKQLLADLYESRGRYRDAQKMLEQVQQTAPSSGQILFQMGRIAYREGDREGALGFLAHARELEPGNAATHFFFGMICVELNLLPDAKKSLEEAVRLNSANTYYIYALGSVLVQGNELDEAIRCFKKLQEIKPDDARARFALGVAYYYSFRYDEARLELQAIANHPEIRVGAQLFLGRMDLKSRNFDDAIEHLQASIEADPSVSEAYTDLGMIYLEKKEYALAEKELGQAMRISPDSYLSNQRLLTLYLRTKDPRADAQAQRVEQIRKSGQEKEQLLMRTLEIRPY
jgi:tetratricopeptide (TPR) repeat protein